MERELKREKACAVLRALGENLGLSAEDLGTMFGVTGETAGAWQDGAMEIPETTFAKMIAAQTALDRMLWLFRPERLPQVIRRRAEAFDGERALDWILDGRIAEVAERYDTGLSYLPRTA
jgi:hypothetical protein